jgi:hypothetical protein
MACTDVDDRCRFIAIRQGEGWQFRLEPAREPEGTVLRLIFSQRAAESPLGIGWVRQSTDP